MADRDLPPAEYLRQRLRYDPETGKLYWRENPTAPKTWNTRYADTEAFTTNFSGYRQGTLDKRRYLAHRVAWAIYYGDWPADSIDHIDHDPCNNRIENLREVSHAENMKNMRMHRTNTSGATGVYWHPRRSKWMAAIRASDMLHHLGYFNNIGDAIAARKAAEAEYGFHTNHGVEAVQSA